MIGFVHYVLKWSRRANSCESLIEKNVIDLKSFRFWYVSTFIQISTQTEKVVNYINSANSNYKKDNTTTFVSNSIEYVMKKV